MGQQLEEIGVIRANRGEIPSVQGGYLLDAHSLRGGHH